MGTESLWAFYLLLTVFVAILQMFLLLMCPETPDYLVKKGRFEEAAKGKKSIVLNKSILNVIKEAVFKVIIFFLI